MKKTAFVVLMVFALALTASAQTKVAGKAHCAKADPEYMIEVGDKPGHLMGARKAACTWTTPMEIEGAKSTTGTDVATQEVSGSTMRDSGYHNATMDNGDTFTVRFQGLSKMNKDNSGPFEGKWTFVTGTGKLKGIKGGGTFKGMAAADGSADVDVEGDYTIAPPPPPPAKKEPAKKS
jgi:glucose dehydrogenase